MTYHLLFAGRLSEGKLSRYVWPTCSSDNDTAGLLVVLSPWVAGWLRGAL